MPSIEWLDVTDKKDVLINYGRNEIMDKSEYVAGRGYAFHEKSNSTDCQIPIEYRTGNLLLKAYPLQNETTVTGRLCWSPPNLPNRGLSYGYYEIKMRVKGFDNMFAFWLYRDPDEIDVYESTGFKDTGHNYGYGYGQHVYPWGSYNGDVFTHYWNEREPYTTKPDGEIARSVINAFRKNEIRNVGDDDWVVLGLLYTKEFWGVYVNDHEVGRGYDHQTIGYPMDVLLDVYVNSDRLTEEMMNEEILYEWEIDYFRYYKVKNEDEIFSKKWMIGLIAEKEEKVASNYKPQVDNSPIPLKYIGIDQLVEGKVESSESKRRVFYVGESNYIYNLYYNKDGWHNAPLSEQFLKEEQCMGDIIVSENSAGRNQVFYKNIDGWIATYYWDSVLKKWIHSYLTTNWDADEKCGGDIKISSNNHIYYRSINNWIATYYWKNSDGTWKHKFLTNNFNNLEEEQCFGDIAVGEQQIFYRNKMGLIASYEWDQFSSSWQHEIISNENQEEMCSIDGDIIFAENKLFFKNVNQSIVGYNFELGIANKLFINLNPLNLEEQKCQKSLNVSKHSNIFFVNSEGIFSNYYWKDNGYKFGKIDVSSYFSYYNNIYPTKGIIFTGYNKLYYVNENGDLATLSYGGDNCEGTQSEWGFYDYEFWKDPDYITSYIDHSSSFSYTECDENAIVSHEVINSPNIVNLISQSIISLLTGFEVQLGAEFNVGIENCE